MVIGSSLPSQSAAEEREEPMVAPHMNADAYRNDTTGTFTHSYWDYIRFHPDGTLLIGCSELTGRYWDGGVIVGKLPEPGQDINSSTKRAITSNSGTSDGFFIEHSNKILLCEDSGAISVWSCPDDVWKVWQGVFSVSKHDDIIMAADYLVPNKELVSVAADGEIKIWNVDKMVSIRNYKGAHSLAINDVAVQPKSFSTFATVSLDQYVSVWSEDTTKPVCEVLKNNCGLRCIKWLDEFKLVFGDDAGVLRLVDFRNPEAALNTTQFPAAVHRITVHPESNKIAVCCDNKIVTVCDVAEDKFKVIYQNRDKHTNYARGCAWDLSDENVLYSVGYDGDLKTHSIATTEVDV